MKSQHTKGEWKVNTDNDGDINTVFSVYHGAICSFPKFYGVKKTEDGNKELEANAKLIAAAPLGLETAIKTYIDLLQIDNVWRFRHQETYCRLRDFIAEATGNTSQEVQEYYEQIAFMRLRVEGHSLNCNYYEKAHTVNRKI